MRCPTPLVVVLVALLCAASPAWSAPSQKKAIWGPTQVDGVSQFPTYADLGVGLYQTTLDWSQVAPTRPANPGDPNDPAYRWPTEIDYAIEQGRRHGIEVSLLAIFAPPWANGGRSREWAPRQPADYAAFVAAASRRYPAVRQWLIWGEPTKRSNFKPLVTVRRERPTRLKGRQARGPRLYARILDAAYGSLKSVRKSNLVVGGNTFTTGDVSPREFILTLRLPNGRPPRMDLWGHNPFGARRPDLSKGPLPLGYADFSDLDTLTGWLDRHQRRRGRRPLRLFLSEYTAPSDHANFEFNFHVTQKTQADWLGAALRITRRWSRIYTLGWLTLYDDPPNGPNGKHGDDVHRGLLDSRGRKKPSYAAYKRG